MLAVEEAVVVPVFLLVKVGQDLIITQTILQKRMVKMVMMEVKIVPVMVVMVEVVTKNVVEVEVEVDLI